MGDTGSTGPVGDTGVCECFDLPLANITETVVTGTLLLSGGNFTCEDGAQIGYSCLTGVTCPNTTSCDLQAQSLILTGGSPTGLVVGGVDDFGGEVIMGDSADYTGSFPYPTYTNILSRIQTFAFVLQLEGLGSTALTARQGDLLLAAIQNDTSSIYMTSSGSIQITSRTGITIQDIVNGDIFLSTTSPGAIIQGLSTGGYIFGTGPWNISTSQFVLGTGTSNWFRTNTNSYFCNGVPQDGDSGTNALFVDVDLVMRNGGDILTNSYTGVIRLGPVGIELCGGLLVSSTGTPLQLQDDPAAAEIDMRGTIINGDNTQPVGSGTVVGAVYFGDDVEVGGDLVIDGFLNITGGFSLSGDVVVDSLTTTVGDVTSAADVVATGNFMTSTGDFITTSGDVTASAGTITGNDGQFTTATIGVIGMDAAGAITGVVSINGNTITAGPGTCCTSDERVKEHIRPLNPFESLYKMLSLKPVEYRFKQDYLKADKWVKDHVYTGFLAQDVRHIVSHAVSTVNRTIHGIGHIPDFHQLHKEELVPIATGAIHALHELHQSSKQTIETLRGRVERLEHDARVHRAQLEAEMREHVQRMTQMMNKIKHLL